MPFPYSEFPGGNSRTPPRLETPDSLFFADIFPEKERRIEKTGTISWIYALISCGDGAYPCIFP
jgi:hypothetical protein